jgi:hypothetical protein
MPPTGWAELEAVTAEALRHARGGHWDRLVEALESLDPLQAELATGSGALRGKADIERLLDMTNEIAQLAHMRRTELSKALDSTRRQQRMMRAYATTRDAA